MMVMTQALADRYQAHFSLDDWEHIAHPAILFAPEFAPIIEAALKANAPITRGQIEQITGPLNWDEE